MAKRGQLTTALQLMAVKFWGREITQTELRLYAYVHSCACNERKIDPRKVNQEERKIMQIWKQTDHFDGGMTRLYLTKEFFDFINDILYYSYFIYDEIEDE